jgi:predicted transcriptional regulator
MTNERETDPDDERFDEEQYPATLRIVVRPDDRALDGMRERADRWIDGEAVAHIVSFGETSALRQLLTDRRVELLRSVMADRPASISALSDRLERDYRDVYDDLDLLADYDIVRFRTDGRAKQSYVSYEEIEFSGTITADRPAA